MWSVCVSAQAHRAPRGVQRPARPGRRAARARLQRRADQAGLRGAHPRRPALGRGRAAEARSAEARAAKAAPSGTRERDQPTRRRPATRGDQPEESTGVARELRVVRWGLVPSWAKDTSIGSRLINARAETVAEKPSFRRAFARRRCLLPADGYYEWQRLDETGSDDTQRPGQGQAAVLHLPPRRRPAGLRRPVRAVAGPAVPGRPPARLAVDGHDHHHRARRTSWARSTTGCRW